MREHQVIVTFGPGPDDEFEYRLDTQAVAARPAADARRWFDHEFTELECDVASPVGKVLAADRLLGVAKYSGVQRFRGDTAWARDYALNAAALVGRDVIRVDVPNETVGY